MHRPLLAVSIAICLLTAPRVVAQAPCTMTDLGQKVTCLEGVIKAETAARQRELATYVTEAGLTRKGYITKTTLEGMDYVTGTDLGNKKYVTDADLDQKDYVTDAGLTAKNYVTKTRFETELAFYAKNIKGDYFWILLAVVLVLLMQGGFLFLEWGVIRFQFDRLLAAYKISALLMTYAGYLPIGFALMFGASWLGGLLGGTGTPASVTEGANRAMDIANQVLGVTNSATEVKVDVRSIGFFLFQAAFAATAVTIPSGAIAERMSVKGFAFASLCLAAIIYPVYGHWAWGGSIYSDRVLESLVIQSDGTFPTMPLIQGITSVGWLQRHGFHDFAGSTVVHSVGGWFALVGALMLGPRDRRFGPNPRQFHSTSLSMAWAGGLFLFFGWFGFNGGSKLAYSTSVDDVVFSTVVAGFSAALASTAFAVVTEWLWPRGYLLEKAIGGFLGGLVAITASCDLTTAWWQSAAIGAVAGVVHNLVFDGLLKSEIDDPVGAIPVHLGCGIWGTFCVALLNGHFVVQIVGILAAFAWTFVSASLVFGILAWPAKYKKVAAFGEWLFLSDIEKRLFVRN